MRRYSLIILVLLTAWQLQAQILTVKSGFSADSVMLGEQLNFHISVESDKDVFIEFPQLLDTVTSEIEIIASEPADTLLTDGKQVISLNYLVASFSPGWNTVPPLPVTFNTGAISDTAYTSVQLLTVLAPVVDTTQAIMPLKPPVNTPVSFAEIMPYVAIGWGSFAVLAIIVYLLGGLLWKKEEESDYDEPKEPAYIIAFRDLEELKEQKLPQNGRIKDYYSRLTEIIRIYMSRQFHIHAMECTSAEILEAFSLQYKRDNELAEMLDHLLGLADLVKFAKEDPLMKENEANMQNAVEFVRATQEYILEQEKLMEEAAKEKEIVELENTPENG